MPLAKEHRVVSAILWDALVSVLLPLCLRMISLLPVSFPLVLWRLSPQSSPILIPILAVNGIALNSERFNSENKTE